MKGLFPQFDPYTPKDFEAIWKNALFVFDTNVLLSLYRYQSKTRDQLLELLDQLSDQIWIPHHVALEFQRNRATVIADQINRFTEVEKVVKKSRDSLRSDLEGLQLAQRHSLIDPDKLTNEFDRISKDFLTYLEDIQKKQQELNSPDPLKAKIESLFDGKVGKEPENQKNLDDIYIKRARSVSHCLYRPAIWIAKKKSPALMNTATTI
ncbi:hypothetical protein PSA7680_03169 [Pseudoruegeria aquimaris]|uniref:PIN like domain-containing protein n=1 Tax=Pseudoruegeria aquimaris TaxID=393663 RepID=A0A1Y5TBY2_9RHOB|nr:PIN domain-containing protein [Pseudoruegeria aquimaris]SLN60284.1 hypothetical protein PSA7680_03169 [Pseudoruegeria aquimaris]